MRLSIALGSEGSIGRLRGRGENPELFISKNNRLNIILNENSLNNLAPDKPYIIMSEFDMLNEDRSRIRLTNNNINNLIGYFLGNNYAISLVENNNNNIIANNIVRHVLNPNNNDPVYITGNATISLLRNNSQLFGTIISILENSSQQFGNHPVFMVSYNEIAEYAASFFMRNNSEIWFENNSDNEITIVLRNSITVNHNNNDNDNITPSITFTGEKPIRVELRNNNIEANRIGIYSNIVTLVITANNRGLIGVGNNPRLFIEDNRELVVMINENCLHSIIAGRTRTIISGFNILNEYRRRIRLADNYNGRIRGSFVNNDYVVARNDNNNAVRHISDSDNNFNSDHSDNNSAVIEEEEDNENTHIVISDNITDNSDNDLSILLSNHVEEEEEEEITLNNNNLIGNNNDIIHHIINLDNNNPIGITNSVTIFQIINGSQIRNVNNHIRENNLKPLENQPIYILYPNETTGDNNRNIIGFILREGIGIDFIGRNIITNIILVGSIRVNYGYVRFRDGPFRIELGSNSMEEANDFYIFDTVTFMIAINNEGLMGGLRGVGGVDSGLLRSTLYLTRDNSILNIMLDEPSIANMMPGIPYPVISGFNISNEDRGRIRLLNNIPGLISYFDDNGNYVILNSGLSFTGWQLNFMSTQLQFVSNLNPEASDFSSSEGRYSIYYVDENTHNTNRLDYITSSDDDTEEEQGQDFAIQTERVRNFLRDFRRVSNLHSDENNISPNDILNQLEILRNYQRNFVRPDNNVLLLNENTEMVNNEHEGLDFMSDLDPEIRNYWLGLIETFHNMNGDRRNRPNEYTIVTLRATEEIIRREIRGNTEGYTSDRLSSSDEENEYLHTILNNIRDYYIYGHFDDLFTIFGDSVAVEEEEGEENDEELNILPSPALNNNVDIIPTQYNNNSLNNIGMDGTFGGGSGF